MQIYNIHIQSYPVTNGIRVENEFVSTRFYSVKRKHVLRMIYYVFDSCFEHNNELVCK